MSILDRLSDPARWADFYRHKLEQGTLREREAADLRRFIEAEEYRPAVEQILAGCRFPLPEKRLVNKTEVGKKRTVYTYPREENYVLKFLAHQLRDYDGLFSGNLYSFRSSLSVRDAVDTVRRRRCAGRLFVYKTDISDYFRSVDITRLLPMLHAALADDERLFHFLKELLENHEALWQGQIIREDKGIVPGAPISSFLANLYLCDMDRAFEDSGVLYLRYSDDIIAFAETRDQLEAYRAQIRRFLDEKKLTINPEKEQVFAPGQAWNFLGFSFSGETVDVSDVSVQKLKAKMRRKARALKRWADKKGAPGTAAARAFLKRFNAKLFENPHRNELTWARWFFPVINTDASLRQIDRYEMECIRFLATGKRTKGRFAFPYEDAKALGYRNLVNEYYRFKRKADGSGDPSDGL